MATALGDTLKTWTTLPLVYLAAILGLFLLIKPLFKPRVTGKIPPSPVRPYPVVGHLPYLASGMRDKLQEWVKSTGDIYRLTLGQYSVVIISSYDLMHEAFVKNAQATSDRTDIMGFIEGGIPRGIISTSGHHWKEQRTVSLNILRQFGMGKNILAVKIAEEVSAFLDELGKLSGKAINIHDLMNTAVSNVINSIVVGRRFEYGDVYLRRMLHLLNEQASEAALSTPATFLPWLEYLPGDFFNAKKRKRRVLEIEKEFCDYYLKKIEQEYDENNLDTFISAYLYEIKKMERQGKDTTLDKSNLSRVIFNLFGAGSETTSTTMSWFMLYMLNFPHIQAKIFAEINEAVGTERAPTIQDRPQLTYLTAAILETQRLASIVPLGLPHLCTKDMVLNGYTISTGTTIMINHDAILWSKDTWENPMEFRPERFIDASGNLDLPKEWTPFSLGRRQCLGESLAKMEIFMFMSGLIQRFELLPAEPGKIPPREIADGITNPPKPYLIRFIERNKQ